MDRYDLLGIIGNALAMVFLFTFMFFTSSLLTAVVVTLSMSVLLIALFVVLARIGRIRHG